jgi:hydrogenase/urease accessory protein HupE
MAWKEICALSLLSITIMLALPAVSASSDSFSDLKSSISGFDDPLMGTEDLAFYLASHGFDATPKGGFVEVDLGGHVYRLIPNGSAPGLASIAA